VTLVTLPGVTDAATMRKISFWRYSAVKRKTLFAALACALLVFGMLGCGQTNDLKTITLGASAINGALNSTQSGFFTLEGNGGTIQLQAIGNYSNNKTFDLTNEVTYTVVVDPVNNVDAYGNPLLPPCEAPNCPAPSAPPYTNGTVEYSPSGLITAIDPATCTWVDIAPAGSATGAYFYTGSYKVTASFGGITSQPLYIPVASAAGNQYYNGAENNPSGLCGPQPTS
jgi:hypothetical protein